MPHHSPIARFLLVLTAAGAACGEDAVAFHGFFSQGYMVTEGNNYMGQTEGQGTFNFNEFAINATAMPIDRLRLGMQIFARSIGDYGSDEPQIDWAYADYQFNDDFSITVGRFKIPHGLYNESRDLDVTRTEVFLPMSVYSTRLRDIYLAVNGAEVSASCPAGMLGNFEIVAYAGGQNVSSTGELAMAYQDGGIQNISSIRIQRVLGGALTWNTPIDGLRAQGALLQIHHLEVVGSTDGYVVAVNGGGPGVNVYGNSSIDDIFPNLWSGVFSLEYSHKDLVVAAEYTREYGKNPTNVVTNTYINEPIGGGQSTVVNTGTVYSTLGAYRRIEGGYLSASYEVMPRLQVSLGRGIAFTDYDHRGLSCNRQWTLAARYDILANWLVKAEWDYVDGTAEVFQTENPNATLSRIWQVFAVKTTVDF